MNDRALAEVLSASERFGAMAGDDFTDPGSFHDVAATLHGLCGRIAAAERASVDVALIRGAVTTAREIHARSPFIRRLQTWPRGYPGDFETIEDLMSQNAQARPRTFEYWLEYLALNSPPAQQHRNKVIVQANEVASTILSGREKPRVLVLAAGSSPDLALAQERIRERDFHVVLNDGDAGAVAFSLARLSGIRDRVSAVHGNVLTSTRRLVPHGPFDLVVAGGLFDYLPDRHATSLLRTIWERLLAPTGRLFLTNIRRGNPYRIWMEYLVDWRLIERSEEEVRDLVSAACGREAVCTIGSEGTRLAWLVSVER